MRQFDEPFEVSEALGRRLVISPMAQADAEPLAGRYRKTLIGRDAYRPLDPTFPGNFGRKGGMFQIHNTESLARLWEDQSENVWVVRPGDQPLGAFWCGLADARYGDLAAACLSHPHGFSHPE